MNFFANPPFGAARVLDTIERALASAGLYPPAGATQQVTQTIRTAFASAGLVDRDPPAPRSDDVVDVEARVVAPVEHDLPLDAPRSDPPAPARPGEFSSHVHVGPSGTRAFKLFVPADRADGPAPLVVMLHGCTQDPDDFAAGTRMNELAAKHGFLVVYPAQSRNANGSNCWNWFRAEDQAREGGEPALIAGIVRQVAASHRVDEKRIFVAGLSAGAAMAVILGATYPDVFAGVGAHSGLPYRAARDVSSAFAAMQGHGTSSAGMPAYGTRARTAAAPAGARTVPTIVVHGDRDATVHSSNGTSIVDRLTLGATLTSEVERGSSAGRGFTRTRYRDGAGRTVVESWVVHGAGHAWSGGSSDGSFTDPDGPDASSVMVRFFLGLSNA